MFCASIIAATTCLWSSFTTAAIAPAVAIPPAAALVAVNRRMTGGRIQGKLHLTSRRLLIYVMMYPAAGNR
jgi:hypothetical protein